MNQELFYKGIKKTVIALPLMFIGPTIIHNAWINKGHWFHYVVLTVGLVLCFLAVYLLWKGIQTMMKGLFNDPK
jgi:hypothetical protein